jgi:hypothetical protein
MMNIKKGLMILLLLFAAPVIAGEVAVQGAAAGNPENPVEKPDKDCE